MKNIEEVREWLKELLEPPPITTENYQKLSNPFVREVVDMGIKVA